MLVIDGIAIDDFYKALETLNPADIESYDILKDASGNRHLWIEGRERSHPVTTRRAKSGKTSISYNGYVGLENQSRELPLLNAQEWRNATGPAGAGYDKGGDENWQKNITQTAFSQSHNLAFSGGSQNLSFYGSLGYINQQGIVRNTGRESFSGRMLVNQRGFENKLNVQLGINTMVTNRNFLPDQNATSFSRLGGSFIFDGSQTYLPVWPAYQPDGSVYIFPSGSGINPLFFLTDIYSKKRENFFQTNIKGDYEIIPGLKVGGLAALSRANDIYDFFFPGISFAGFNSFASKSDANKSNITTDLHAGYKKEFQQHRFELTGVYEYNRFLNDGFSAGAQGYLLPQLLDNNLGANTIIRNSDIQSYKNEVKLISFLVRLNYNYDDRYLLTLNFRRDGSSKFGANNRWGNFPSAAFAWRANNEAFLRDASWLNDLKLRVSYGTTGNQENIPPYAYQSLYGPLGNYYYNGNVYPSYGVVQEYNPDLKWEVRKSFNVGVDFSVLNDRLGCTIDYFNDKTQDMLFEYSLPQPPFLTDKVTANAADAINTGFELTLRATAVSSKRLQWNIQLNLATLQSKITNLSGTFRNVDLNITNRHYGYASGSGLSGAYVSQLQVGYPAGVFWLPQFAGPG